MSNFRRLSLATLAIATVATVVGCGQANLPLAANPQAAGHAPVIMAAGESHILGFDMKRYKTVFAPKAHKTHVRRQAMLPGSVDLRPQQAPVYDQGHLGSCTAFAIAKGFREFLQRKNGETPVALSGLWFYYNERAAQGSVSYDSGSTLTEGFEVLSRKGAATDETWPYDITKFKAKPPAAADSTAAANKIAKAVQLDNLDDVKAELAAGYDVSFGFTVYESFRKIGADGVMPVPAGSEQVLGGHAVTAVGYDDAKKVLIVRNSWSDKWGDKGYFYMPYSVFQRDADDFWSATK